MSETPISLRPEQSRDLEVRVVASSLDNMRKEALTTLLKPDGKSFTLVCDEGPYLGGDDSAPPPLSFFSTGVAF